MKLLNLQPMFKSITLAAAMLVALAGQPVAAETANDVASVDKSFGAFYGIVVNTQANVVLEQGTKPAVRIEGKRKDIDKVEVKVSNGMLVITGTNTVAVNIHVTVEEINRVEVNGGARVYASQVIHSDVLFLKVNGNGSIRLGVRALSLGMLVKGKGKIVISGTAGESYGRILGDGRIQANNLDSYTSRTEVSRGNTAQVTESDKSGRRMTLRMTN